MQTWHVEDFTLRPKACYCSAMPELVGVIPSDLQPESADDFADGQSLHFDCFCLKLLLRACHANSLRKFRAHWDSSNTVCGVRTCFYELSHLGGHLGTAIPGFIVIAQFSSLTHQL